MSTILQNAARGQRGAKTQIQHAHTDRLHVLIHDLFPIKPAAHLAEITGLSISAFHKSVRERRDFSSGALWSLFAAPIYGSKFFRAFMGDGCRARYFVEMQRRERIREIEEEFEPAMREIDEQAERPVRAAAARRNEDVRSMGQAGASTAAAKATLLKGQAR